MVYPEARTACLERSIGLEEAMQGRSLSDDMHRVLRGLIPPLPFILINSMFLQYLKGNLALSGLHCLEESSGGTRSACR
jgi:hypothetical protein